MKDRTEYLISHMNSDEADNGTLLSDLMTARGACGSYTKVFVHTMQKLGYTCRIAQMKSGQSWGVHIIAEVKTKDGWVVADPLYNLYFKTPQGKMASFADVSNQWNYYKNQLPPNYKMEYNYEDVRYTNWNKVPLIMPAIKSVLNASIGKEAADQICIRSQMLSLYKVYFYLLLILVFFLSIFLTRRSLHFRYYKSVIRSRMKVAA
jgi:hypothetical protein